MKKILMAMMLTPLLVMGLEVNPSFSSGTVAKCRKGIAVAVELETQEQYEKNLDIESFLGVRFAGVSLEDISQVKMDRPFRMFKKRFITGDEEGVSMVKFVTIDYIPDEIKQKEVLSVRDLLAKKYNIRQDSFVRQDSYGSAEVVFENEKIKISIGLNEILERIELCILKKEQKEFPGILDEILKGVLRKELVRANKRTVWTDESFTIDCFLGYEFGEDCGAGLLSFEQPRIRMPFVMNVCRDKDEEHRLVEIIFYPKGVMKRYCDMEAKRKVCDVVMQEMHEVCHINFKKSLSGGYEFSNSRIKMEILSDGTLVVGKNLKKFARELSSDADSDML